MTMATFSKATEGFFIGRIPNKYPPRKCSNPDCDVVIADPSPSQHKALTPTCGSYKCKRWVDLTRTKANAKKRKDRAARLAARNG